MSAGYSCPKGHTSAEADYCDTCGAAISGAPAAPTASPAVPSEPAPPVPSGTPALCPVCSTPRAGADRFCENDGYDFTTGRRPDSIPPATAPTAVQATPPPPTAGTPWTATAEADRGYFDRNAVEGVDFPAVCPTRNFTLSGPEIRIGRRSQSKGINPEIDLSGPPLDPGISHLHAVLIATSSGWSLTDPGSTNGTTINDSNEPLDPTAAVPVGDGDRIHLGAWTTITLHDRP